MDELSGRFLRIPAEHISRELHPWMRSSAWWESYVRMQKHAAWQDHKTKVGVKIYDVKRGECPVSVSWLVKCCPDLTEKSARTFLNRLEAEGLIEWTHGGKKRGRKVNFALMTPYWGDLLLKKGRSREERKRRRKRDLHAMGSRKGQFSKAAVGNFEGEGAISEDRRAISGTETESTPRTRGDLKRAIRAHEPRVSDVSAQHEGRSPAGGAKEGGTIGGEDRGGAAPPTHPASQSVSPPQHTHSSADLDRIWHAVEGYLLSDGAVRFAGRKEISGLKTFLKDLAKAQGLDLPGLVDWLADARRWADAELPSKALRMNHTFLRVNQSNIEDFRGRSRAADMRQAKERDERARRHQELLREQAQSDWLTRIRAAEKKLTKRRRRALEKRAEEELGPPTVNTDDALRYHQLAVKAKVFDLLGEELGDPRPTEESHG